MEIGKELSILEFLGLGTKLMMEMERTVIEEKLLSKLNLEVHEKNIKAFNFYKN